MMDTFRLFIFDHPFLFFFLALAGILVGYELVNTIIFELPSRIMRARNIRLHGWPPAHCDADGDAVEEVKEEK